MLQLSAEGSHHLAQRMLFLDLSSSMVLGGQTCKGTGVSQKMGGGEARCDDPLRTRRLGIISNSLGECRGCIHVNYSRGVKSQAPFLSLHLLVLWYHSLLHYSDLHRKMHLQCSHEQKSASLARRKRRRKSKRPQECKHVHWIRQCHPKTEEY